MLVMDPSRNFSITDDLDSEGESPYLRRPRPVEVRRGRVPRGFRRLLGWLVTGILIVTPLGFATGWIVGYALNSPRFCLSSPDDIVVQGNRYLPRETLISALGLPLGAAASGTNIFRISMEEERKRVEAIPWVRSATVTRVYPHGLAVSVVERAPVAFVNVGGQLKLVDGDGILLEKPEKGDFNFPVVSGLDGLGDVSARAARLSLYQAFMRDLSSDALSSGWMISEVDLSDADDVLALLVQGHETIQVHFGHEKFFERFQDFLALLPELRKTTAQVGSVDLRYNNQVIVNPLPGSPSASTAPRGPNLQKD